MHFCWRAVRAADGNSILPAEPVPVVHVLAEPHDLDAGGGLRFDQLLDSVPSRGQLEQPSAVKSSTSTGMALSSPTDGVGTEILSPSHSVAQPADWRRREARTVDAWW